MRNGFLLLSCIALTFTVSGCKTVMDPTFMPSGYAHHHKAYKSPPGDKPWGVGYEYTKEQNDEALRIWHATADEMLSELEKASGISSQPVYLALPVLDNAFTYSYDHALRDALRAGGYTLVSEAGPETLTLVTGGYDPEFQDTMREFDYNDVIENEKPPEPIVKEIILTLAATQGVAQLGTLEGAYTMPLYGYEDEQMHSYFLNGIIGEVWR